MGKGEVEAGRWCCCQVRGDMEEAEPGGASSGGGALLQVMAPPWGHRLTEGHGMESAMERILVKCHVLDGWRGEARIWWREGCELGGGGAQQHLPA